jgi:hypothetical protein
MTFVVKRMVSATAVGMALIGGGLMAPPAQAGYVVTLTQQGSNVVASGSGTIDLTGLSFSSSDTINSGMFPSDGAITTGADYRADFRYLRLLRGHWTNEFRERGPDCSQ